MNMKKFVAVCSRQSLCAASVAFTRDMTEEPREGLVYLSSFRHGVERGLLDTETLKPAPINWSAVSDHFMPCPVFGDGDGWWGFAPRTTWAFSWKSSTGSALLAVPCDRQGNAMARSFLLEVCPSGGREESFYMTAIEGAQWKIGSLPDCDAVQSEIQARNARLEKAYLELLPLEVVLDDLGLLFQTTGLRRGASAAEVRTAQQSLIARRGERIDNFVHLLV